MNKKLLFVVALSLIAFTSCDDGSSTYRPDPQPETSSSERTVPHRWDTTSDGETSSEEETHSERPHSSETKSSERENTSEPQPSSEQKSSSEEPISSEEKSSEKEASSEPESSAEQEDSSENESSSEQSLTPAEKINSMLQNSKPTVSKLTMTYRYPSGKFYVELTYKGTLTVEYGDVIKASYVSEKEVLNDSLEGDFKTTAKNTYYAYGDEIGTLKSDGSIEWDSEAEAAFVLPLLELDLALFDSSSMTVTSTYFYGKVLEGKEAGIVNENVSSLDLSLRFSQEKLSTLKSNYVTEKGASVSLSCSYTYRSVTVSIPE